VRPVPSRARHALRITSSRAPALRRLPRKVAVFQARAHALALKLDDAFALDAAARPDQLAELLRCAEGRRSVVELGTATAWTAASFVLADTERQVVTVDPVAQPHRAAYLDLLDDEDRARIELVQATGADAATHGDAPVDLLFVDSTHERDDTVAEFKAWAPRLAPGAVVVFHDWDNPAFPGVAQAVEQLALNGRSGHGMFVATPRP
jgi:predicted O-methyltransferase YrrM